MAKPPLVLIPGLGADAGLFAPQRDFFGDRLVVPPWIRPRADDESLASYARRLGRSLDVPRPFWLGGISFGGMMATEIAADRPDDVEGVILLASCTHRGQVTLPFRVSASVGPYVPVGIARGVFNRLVPQLFATAEGVRDDPRVYDVLEGVAYRTDIRLFNWGISAIRKWRDGPDLRHEAFRAHGDKDAVIPMRGVDMRPGVDLVIPGGRHLIHLTHADVVNRWIASKLDAPSV